jgi:single-strand DNA-binding protein
MNFNKVMLAGRLTRDVQLRYTPSGSAVGEFGLAVNRVFSDGSGQKREETCFVDIVVWKKQAETCQKYLHKGSPAFIDGRLTFDSWEDKEGQKRSRLRVVAESVQFIGGPDRSGGRGEDFGQGPGQAQAPVAEPSQEYAPASEPANEIPF